MPAEVEIDDTGEIVDFLKKHPGIFAWMRSIAAVGHSKMALEAERDALEEDLRRAKMANQMQVTQLETKDRIIHDQNLVIAEMRTHAAMAGGSIQTFLNLSKSHVPSSTAQEAERDEPPQIPEAVKPFIARRDPHASD